MSPASLMALHACQSCRKLLRSIPSDVSSELAVLRHQSSTSWVELIVWLVLAFTYSSDFQKVVKRALVRIFRAKREYFVSAVYDTSYPLLWMSKNAAQPLPQQIDASFHIQQLRFDSNYLTETSGKLHVVVTCEQTGQVSHLFVSRQNWDVYLQLSRVLKNKGITNVCFGSWSAIPSINEVGQFLTHEPCCYLYQQTSEPPVGPIIPDKWGLIVTLLFALLSQFFNSHIHYYVYGFLAAAVFFRRLYTACHSTYRKQFHFQLLDAMQRSLSDRLFGKLKCLHTRDPMTHKLWKPAGLRRKFVVSSFTRHEFSSNENSFYAPRVITSIADYDGSMIEPFERELRSLDGRFAMSICIESIDLDLSQVSINSTLYYRTEREFQLANRSAYCVKKLLEWCRGCIPDAIFTYHWWMNNVDAKDFTCLVLDSELPNFTGYGVCIARSTALISPWVS